MRMVDDYLRIFEDLPVSSRPLRYVTFSELDHLDSSTESKLNDKIDIVERRQSDAVQWFRNCIKSLFRGSRANIAYNK